MGRRRILAATVAVLGIVTLFAVPVWIGGSADAKSRSRPPAAAATALEPARRMSVGRSSGSDTQVVAYFTSWGIYERGFEIADIPAAKLSHLNYAFANVVDGRCAIGDRWADIDRPLPSDDPALPYRGNFNQLQVLKARHPHLRTILSVGGSTWSGGFASATATAEGRRAFAASCVDLMTTYGFDGLDIDWEFPGPADRDNFSALLAELRDRLDESGRAAGRYHLLTVAGPAGAHNMANIDIATIARFVDWVNVMTYDFAGDWSPSTGHNAPLYGYPNIEDATFTVDSAARRWVGAGLPAGDVKIGLAFYGRGFAGVSGPTPGSSFRSVPEGTTQPGQFDYDHLAAEVLPGMQVVFDPAARVPYAFDRGSGIWISYDDASSIEAKGRYIAANGYGGAMIWELSNDRDDELLDAALRGLGTS